MSKSFEAKSTWCWCKKPQDSEATPPECEDSVGTQVVIADPAKIAYVQNWVDAHRRYFTPPPTGTRRQPQLLCNMSPHQYGRPEVNYFYTEPIDFSVRKNINLPHIMKSPHPISPLRMLRK